ncbi:TPA: protein tyrosine phosphatase [Klebsiella quasipneumoniae subsp. quasipneumoniae]|uniref:arsenate reductase/protein-tyrosine-phosphatase family protein n=1 Tax=Klebsiella quasipneumoniae TaxID=1463165 RepID=UPI003CF1CA04
MFDSVLVVCTGNICRSPMGERILQSLLPEKRIKSAGVGALVGHPADPLALQVSNEKGINLEGHSGTQFTTAMSIEYDLILVMDKNHIEQVSKIAPHARGKTMLIGHWMGNKEIPDPYKQSKEAFEFVYQLIDEACRSWALRLR